MNIAQIVEKLSAKELRKLAKLRCEHTHSYLQHPACYKPNKVIPPKVLLFDLETTAHEGYFWGHSYETSIIENTGYGKILSYSAKWLGGKSIVKGWCDFKSNGEKKLVKELWNLFDEADYVIGHNCKSFDIKWCNLKFAYYKLKPPSPYKVIDTKTEAKKYLYLPSYSLNNVSDYFGLGAKLEHQGFSLWKKCIQGDRNAWRIMKKYNLRDVILLEKVFLCLKPFNKKYEEIR